MMKYLTLQLCIVVGISFLLGFWVPELLIQKSEAEPGAIEEQPAFSEFAGGFIWETLKTDTHIERIDKDVAGRYRVWIAIDNSHAVVVKFAKIPTVDQVRMIRAGVIAAEDQAKAQAEAETAKIAQAETWKAEGRCPTCGQVLPKDGGK